MVWKDPERHEDEDEDDDDEEKKEKKKKPGPGMRNAGIGLTLGGLGVGIAGVAVIAAGEQSSSSRQVGPTYIGGVIAGVGGAMFLVGIPLWAVGSSRYKAPGEPSTAGASLVVGATSAAVQGRF